MKIIHDPEGLEDYCLIPIFKHKKLFATVKISPEDYEWIYPLRWYNCQGYARRDYRDVRKGIFMHREIIIRLGYDMDGLVTDHKNRDKLDNRRKNLRPATKSQNSVNIIRDHGEVSYRGVQSYGENEYISFINKVPGKGPSSLLISDNPVLCAIAYDLAALQFHREFAILNFPDYDYSGMTLKQFIFEQQAKKHTSGYRGVWKSNHTSNTWVAELRVGSESETQKATRYPIGVFDNEVSAAIAYDLKQLEILGKVSNFDIEDYPDGKYKGITLDEFVERCTLERQIRHPELRRRAKPSRSKYLNVLLREDRGVWDAYFKYKGKTYRVGESHETEEEAAIAVDRLRLEVCQEWGISRLNFHLSNYMDLVEKYNLHEFLEMMPKTA